MKTALRDRLEAAREKDDELFESADALLEIVKRLEAIEHAVGAVAKGVMTLQQEEQ